MRSGSRSMVLLWLAIALAWVFIAAARWAPATRPTREYVVYYDAGLSIIVEADDVDSALAEFRSTVKHGRVFSVAQRSYVDSVWIYK